MEGLEGASKSTLICATNRRQDLDPALLSRFDLQLNFQLPNEKARRAIFGRYAKQLSDEGKAEGMQGPGGKADTAGDGPAVAEAAGRSDDSCLASGGSNESCRGEGGGDWRGGGGTAQATSDPNNQAVRR